MNRRTRTAAAWIALVAMLLAVLLPTVARAAAAEAGIGLEICSTGTPAPAGAPATAAQGHCPYCTLQGAGWAPPPAALQAAVPAPAVAQGLQAPAAPAPTLRPHSTAAPRGPPART